VYKNESAKDDLESEPKITKCFGLCLFRRRGGRGKLGHTLTNFGHQLVSRLPPAYVYPSYQCWCGSELVVENVLLKANILRTITHDRIGECYRRWKPETCIRGYTRQTDQNTYYWQLKASRKATRRVGLRRKELNSQNEQLQFLFFYKLDLVVMAAC